MGHVQRMDDGRNTKKIYQASLHQNRPSERPKTRWKGDVENDRREVEIVNWKQVAQVRYRDGWRIATTEALILLGW